MVHGIRTIYPREGLSLRMCVGSWVQHETPEEGHRKYQLKHCEYNNENEDSANILSDKNYQASSQKFRQMEQKTFNTKYFFWFNDPRHGG